MSYYLSNIGGKYDELVSVDGNTVADKKELYSNYTSNTDEEYSIDSVCNNFGLDKEIRKDWASVSTLPYNFYRGGCVVYNNQIHILGGYNSSNYHNQYHCIYDGISWTECEYLIPYNFYDGCAVVYNDEIHILGGSGTNTSAAGHSYHYKCDNMNRWTMLSSLPNQFHFGCAVVYNDEIHILGGANSEYTKHYKYDGTSWTSVSTLPYSFLKGGSAIVYNNEIHILGAWTYSGGTGIKHYKYDGSVWTEVSTLPYYFYYGGCVVYNDYIHILGGCNQSSDSSGCNNHYSTYIKNLNIFIEYKKEE